MNEESSDNPASPSKVQWEEDIEVAVVTHGNLPTECEIGKSKHLLSFSKNKHILNRH